jgi:hypothetical protein
MRFGMHLETAALSSNRLDVIWLLRRRRMNALEKNIANARGEALAASVLASAALQTALLLVPNRAELLTRISAFVDDTLNMSGPGKGDANDEFNTQIRETARFQAMQNLDAIARMFNNPPTKG